jgi:DNA-binding GntR family transcriptional regulator
MSAEGALSAFRSVGPAPSNLDVVVHALRDLLVSGALAPGERLKEAPLAEQLGVSRGPIRDAFRLLEYDGLLVNVPNKGAVVPDVSSADLLEVYAMRAALGQLALRKLLRDDDGPRLTRPGEELLRFEEAVKRGDAAEAAEADLRYQSLIVAAAELPRVTWTWERLTWRLKMCISMLRIDYGGELRVMLSEIKHLDDAIVRRNAVLAERLWREKLERWVQHLIGHLSDGFDRELWSALTIESDLETVKR